jgi:hypothetical protein
MDIKQLEPYILDEWIFIPAVVLILIWSFGIGLFIGWIWVSL